MTVGYSTDASSSTCRPLLMDGELYKSSYIFPLGEDFVFTEPNRDDDPAHIRDRGASASGSDGRCTFVSNMQTDPSEANDGSPGSRSDRISLDCPYFQRGAPFRLGYVSRL